MSTATDTGFATTPEPTTLRFVRTLPGPIERVWAYLTESDKRANWLASGDMDLRLGGDVYLEWNNDELSGAPEEAPERYRGDKHPSMRGKITQLEPTRLLAYTWAEGAEQESEVRFELKPKGDEVELILTHQRLTDRSNRVEAAGGWHTHLAILEQVLTGEPVNPVWATFEKLQQEYDRRIRA
jgi:uncharacterized protein YndB with AHSA1/START domain